MQNRAMLEANIHGRIIRDQWAQAKRSWNSSPGLKDMKMDNCIQSSVERDAQKGYKIVARGIDIPFGCLAYI